ncbi:hypothetical protein BV898_19780 [Hypsibius exemplaris]|uniref:WAP domain-containing protein n=1 Tax=Hypsibius exemplaris TaxID=2072580 RepID=A0A9X6NLH5_HYPEX|nr:hypothetical protein BV898_19780 [Hypsibius exemplaris]
MAFYIFALCCVGLVSLAESCGPPPLNPCKSVTCPTGQTCKNDFSYYCDGIMAGICKTVATCTTGGVAADPCQSKKCPSGQTCVKVADNCQDNKPCTFKAQCNANNRPGRCPAPPSVVTSCDSDCQDDHYCKANTKCCPGPHGRKYCLAV